MIPDFINLFIQFTNHHKLLSGKVWESMADGGSQKNISSDQCNITEVIYLTIIPLTRMGSESIAHEA